MSLKTLAEGWSTVEKIMAALVSMAIVGAVVGSAVEFLRDAPAIVEGNTSHVLQHHDSIVDLYAKSGLTSGVVQHVEEHLATEDSANRARDRKLDYLVCLRIERKRELDSLPAIVDCDAELLR